MKKKNVITILISIIIVGILTFAFASCGSTDMEDDTTSLSTTEEVVTDEVVKPTKPVTDKETEEATTKSPSTTKAPETTQKPTEAPEPTEKPTERPTQKPTEAPETQPSGGGGLDMSDAGKGPNTDHVGGESSEEMDQAVQDSIDKNGWDVDWELN